MSATPAKLPVETTAKSEVAIPRSADDLTAQIHLEYTRYLEKRNCVRAQLRKENGRLRRSMLHSQLAS